MSFNESSMRHGHPGKSCMSNGNWHMVFSRQLTDDEWGKIGRLIDLHLNCWDPVNKTFVAIECEKVVRSVCGDVTCELREPIPA